MTVLSKSLLTLGLLLLTHATYSAHEYHTLLTSLPSSSGGISGSAPPAPQSSAPTPPTSTLPTDILLETLLSTLLLSAALILRSPGFQPISWREWAGKIERDGGGRGNPYLAIDRRDGFVDIRARRREFAEWVKGEEGEKGEGGKVEK